LRAPLERFASEQLEREVAIAEPFELHLLGSVRLQVGELRISAPAGFEAPHFARVSNGHVQLRYGDLLKFRRTNQLRIKSLEVAEIDTRLIRHEDGQASWHFDKDPNKPRKPFPVIEHLIATKGYAEVLDAIHEVDLKVEFKTNEGTANGKATSSIATKGKYRKQPLRAKLETDGFLPIASAEKDSPPIRSKGWLDYTGLRLDFDGSVSDLFGAQNIKGKAKVSGPSLHVLGSLTNSVLPTTDPFKLHGTVDKYDDVWNVHISDARIGSSQLAAKVHYDPRPKRPLLSGELTGKRLVLEDLFPAFGARGHDPKQAKASKAPKDKLFADRPLDLPSLNKMDAKMMVHLDYIDLGKAFAKPIKPLHAELSMDAGKLALAEIDARTADGSISGTISVDAHQEDPVEANQTGGEDAGKDKALTDKKIKGPPSAWRIDLQWKQIDLEKWLQVSEDRKQQAQQAGKEVPPAYMTGTLNGRTRLGGMGNSTHALLSSLDGDISMYISDGTISHLLVELMGIDLAQAIGLWFGKDNSLKMQCAVMDFDTKNGIVTPQVALIDTEVTLALIDGKVDLGQEQLDLRLSAKPKNMSPFTLRSPIRVRGSFVDPQVRPEGGPIAARVAGSVALAFLNPIAAILPFIDLGSSDDKASPCNQSLADFRRLTGGKPADSTPAK
jgi:AsmA protein